MFASDLECQPKRQGPPGPTQDEQLVELKHRLAEQILAGVEMRDRHSRWLHRSLAAIAKTAKTYGMTTDQHQAVMDAVLDPDEAMAKLAELEAATVHQSAAGEDKRGSGCAVSTCPSGAPLRLIHSDDSAPVGRSAANLEIRTAGGEGGV